MNTIKFCFSVLAAFTSALSWGASDPAADMRLIGAERVVRCALYADAIIAANNYVPDIAYQARVVSVAYHVLKSAIPVQEMDALGQQINAQMSRQQSDQILTVVRSCAREAKAAQYLSAATAAVPRP